MQRRLLVIGHLLLAPVATAQMAPQPPAPAAVLGLGTVTDGGGFQFPDELITPNFSPLPDGPPLTTSCVGPEGGLGVIYLHGIDPPSGTPQEQGNRSALRALAEELGIRIALVRSPDHCPNNQVTHCWPNESRVAVLRAYDKLTADAGSCFGMRVGPPRDDHEGPRPAALMVGFSNGGYFAGKVFQYCLAPHMAGIIGIGSAGSWQPSDPRLDLGGCGRFFQLIGKDDHYTHDLAFDYVHRLADRGGRVLAREVQGGHIVPLPELKMFLKVLLRPSLIGAPDAAGSVTLPEPPTFR